jgi:hypothetical protein
VLGAVPLFTPVPGFPGGMLSLDRAAGAAHWRPAFSRSVTQEDR